MSRNSRQKSKKSSHQRSRQRTVRRASDVAAMAAMSASITPENYPEMFAAQLLEVGVDPSIDERLADTEAARTVRRVRAAPPAELADGTLGYYVRWPRLDDCQAAALATALEVPIADVPDPRIDERLATGESADDIDRSAMAELDRWLAGRGLRMAIHCKEQPLSQRWIGICAMSGAFQSHCLVMSGNEVLFDPARVPLEGGAVASAAWVGTKTGRLRQWGFEDISYGLSFQSNHEQEQEK
jgi:hypothetical protein